MAKSVIPGGLTIARRGRLGVLTAVSADGKPIDLSTLDKDVFDSLPDEVKANYKPKAKPKAAKSRAKPKPKANEAK